MPAEPYPPSTALILVVVMPERRDMEIARLLGWYRIPLRFAPKVIAVDFLAFYQTDAFGEEHRWQIECFAPVRGHELTTRKELFREEVEHPRANEEYYKITLGPLQNLAQPISADKWKRITFLYTTGELLNKAKTLADLVVQADERQILWQALREHAEAAGQYQAGELLDEHLGLDPMLLAMLGALDLNAGDEPH